jgi:Copper transport outer membrane protein, MctB
VISFRYHLVSIVAVFLALALGIVVGTTALNGPITTDLRKQVNTLKSDRTTLASQVKSLQLQVGEAGQFASSFGAQLVHGTLSKQSVLLIGLPGARSSVEDGITKQVEAAGGTLSGHLELTAAYIDPRRSSDITSLVTSGVHPIGLTLPEVSDAGQLGGALLAFVLLGKGERTDLSEVLSGFAALHMISQAGTAVTPSKTVVVVSTGALASANYAASAELALVTALQRAGGHVVVAGDSSSATQDGVVAAVRGAPGDRATVSTVDNADSAVGQVSAVLAIADVAKSRVGHYGTAKSADALFPNPSS